MKYVIILMLVLLGACSESHPLTTCRGSTAPANPGRWTPTPTDVAIK